jgi:hypothetical protein
MSAGENKAVHFVLLPSAHADLMLVFECQTCHEKKGTEAMLPHAIEHGAEKVTVDTMTALRNRDK